MTICKIGSRPGHIDIPCRINRYVAEIRRVVRRMTA